MQTTAGKMVSGSELTVAERFIPATSVAISGNLEAQQLKDGSFILWNTEANAVRDNGGKYVPVREMTRVEFMSFRKTAEIKTGKVR